MSRWLLPRNVGWDGDGGAVPDTPATGLGTEVTRVDTNPCVPLHDAVALAEIDLYTDVLAAVSEADAPLTTEELDRVLGVRPRTTASPAPARVSLA